MRSPLRALLAKELLDLSRNRGAVVPVVVIALALMVLPFGIVIAIPALTGDQLSEDADLLRLTQVADRAGDLSAEARVQLFMFQQFLLLFLLMPITGAMALAAHSVVGEKQARTLEPLLAAPLSTMDLLIAKVLGALLPTLAISWAALILYFAGLGLVAEPGVLAAILTIRTALLVLLIGPALALLSLQAALVVSSRVNDARTAQQFGVLIILPLTGLVFAQFMGAVWLSTGQTALLGLVLLVLWLLVALVSVALFEREAVLTRWR